MTPRLYIIIIQIVFLSGLLFSKELEQGLVNYYPVDLSIFEGHKSLLLAWSYDDSIDAKSVTIKSRNTIDAEYQIIEKLNPEATRYLIEGCEDGIRYFFLIEIEDYSGGIYTSDNNIPVFGSCTPLKDTTQFDPKVSTIQKLILSDIRKNVLVLDPLLNIDQILPIIISDNSIENVWLEEIHFYQLKNIGSEVSAIHKVFNQSEFFISIVEKEFLYRNQFLIKPNEWQKKIDYEFSLLYDRWVRIYEEYEKSLLLLSKMPSVHIIGVKQIEDDKKNFVIKTVHRNHVNIDESYLLYGNEYLDFSSFEWDSSGCASVILPPYWRYTDLMVNGIFHQRFPLWIKEPVINTIEGELIPGNNIYAIKYRLEPRSAWFNEIIWHPNNLKLDIEAAGKPNYDERYAFKLHNQLIWELEWNSGFEIQYVDSSFLLDQNLNFPVLLSWNKWSNDKWEPLEYMILDSSALAKNRMPDGKSWTELKNSTLGSSNNYLLNDKNTELIPELFVLYQNYPNPFNGSTRLTFDLLEDATVSLYVTDATGRVRDVFVDGFFMNGGTYNYEWSGENRSTGIYFFTIHAQTGNFPPAVMSRKMIYLK